jgi:hypothetical protein
MYVYDMVITENGRHLSSPGPNKLSAEESTKSQRRVNEESVRTSCQPTRRVNEEPAIFCLVPTQLTLPIVAQKRDELSVNIL